MNFGQIFSVNIIPILIGIAILIGSIVVYYELMSYQQEIKEDNKEKLKKAIENVISRREGRIETIASSVVAFFSSSKEVEPSEFDNFSSIVLGSNPEVLNLFVVDNNRIIQSYPITKYVGSDFDQLFPIYPTEIMGIKSMAPEFQIDQKLTLLIAVPFDYFIPSGTIISDHYKLILTSPIDENIKLYEIEKLNDKIKNSTNISEYELKNSIVIDKQTNLFGHKIKKYYDLKYILWDSSFEEKSLKPVLILIPGIVISVIIPLFLIRTNLLKTQLQEKSAALQKANEVLKNTEKSKDEFVTMIVHDLKTPLVPIRSYADMLMSQQLGSLNEKQIQRLDTIRSSADVLLKMIQDLLDANKLELDQLKLSKARHDMAEIITDTVVKLKHDVEKHNIAITTDLENNVFCLCDKNRIDQVLTNLIVNAIDFCPKENGRIHITLKSNKGHAEIIVQDNGIGIPEDKLNRIFVKFYQIDTSAKREYGGTGLGLSICKGIVEVHGGKIWAESKGMNKGTEIHILIPI